MFKIEWLEKKAVIHSEDSAKPTLEAILQGAIARVAEMKSRFPSNPPDSFRIIDGQGLLVTAIVLVRTGDGNQRFR